MKALPALLYWLLLGLAPAWAADPVAPPSLPIIYDQPGTHYILRLDNRRYQLPYITKTGVVDLLATANYPRTKLRFDEFKRALEDKAKADTLINRAQQTATREADRVSRLRRNLDALSAQLLFLRRQPVIDLRDIVFLQDQIRVATTALATAEDQAARAEIALDKTKGSTEITFERTEQAREAYAAALNDFERQLGAIRAVAMTHGTAL